MFVSGKKLLKKAKTGKYAVPAFNTSNLEVSKALFEAAQSMKSPLLIQTTPSAIAYAGLKNLVSLISSLEKNSKVPVCLHLDHGKTFKLVKECVDLGYSSVMIDASKKSFSKNIALTKKVVKYAHKKKVSVEAELGALGRVGEVKLTDAKQAKDFVEKTNVDYLAVAIGTSHGAYKFKGRPQLDFERLKEISELVKVPLVLHGASQVPSLQVKKINSFGGRIKKARGVPNSQIKKAVKLGIAKINIDTDLRLAFTAATREFLKKHPSNFDPRSYLGFSEEAVKKVAVEKIKLFGCKGKA